MRDRLVLLLVVLVLAASPARAAILLPWLIGDDGGVWHHVDGDWTRLGLGSARSLAVVGGEAFVIGNDRQVWKGDRDGSWTVLPGGGMGTRIAADTDGSLYLLGVDGGVYRYFRGSWSRLGLGTGSDLAVFEGTPYVIGTDGRVWYFRGEWIPYNDVAKGQRVSAGTNGVFVIGNDNGVWRVGRKDLQRWGLGMGREIAVAPDGCPWVIGMDGGLWHGDADRQWSRVGSGTARGLAFPR